jgi:hypothetical protein
VARLSSQWSARCRGRVCEWHRVWCLALLVGFRCPRVASESLTNHPRTPPAPLNSGVRRTHEMSFFARLRRWINRDDGRYYRVGNRPIGGTEAIGLLAFVAAIALWQLHVKTGISSIWPFMAGAIGLLLAILGSIGRSNGPEA